MRFLKFIPILFLTALSWNGCTLFKKNISKPVNIAINESAFTATLKSTAINSKYIPLTNPETIVSSFLKGFKTEAGYTKNVTLQYTEENADFALKLTSLEIQETSSTEKINDTKSPYNGQEVVLNTVQCQASFEVINLKSKTKSFLNCINTKSRSEKLKNNRDAGDLITGTNKDRTEYRTKLLDDNICEKLAEDVGRRIWTPITRKIAKNLK